MNMLGGAVKVFDEFCAHAVTIGFFWCTENGGWVISGGQPAGIIAGKELAAVLGDTKIAAEPRLGGGGAHADDHIWFDDEDFGLQPWPAGFDLAGGWFFVKPAFAAWLPAEV